MVLGRKVLRGNSTKYSLVSGETLNSLNITSYLYGDFLNATSSHSVTKNAFFCLADIQGHGWNCLWLWYGKDPLRWSPWHYLRGTGKFPLLPY